MKYKAFKSAISALIMATLVVSCSEESSMTSQIDFDPLRNFVYAPDDSWAQHLISVAVPTEDEIRSRALEEYEAPSFQSSECVVGADGLWSFNLHLEQCDLWYGVYLELDNGKMRLLFDSSDADTPKPVKDSSDESKWTLVYSLPKTINKSKISIFLYAGHRGFTHVVGRNGIINNCTDWDAKFDFTTTELEMNPQTGGQPHSNGYFYNGFYYCGPAFGGGEDAPADIHLKRPWAEIHVLTQEFVDYGELNDIFFPEGVYSRLGMSYEGDWDTWYWRRSDYYLKIDGKNTVPWGHNNPICKWHNTLKGGNHERVTFEGKKMDYLGCFHVPVTKSLNDYGISHGGWNGGISYGNNGNPCFSITDKFYDENGGAYSGIQPQDISQVSTRDNLPETTFSENSRYVYYAVKSTATSQGPFSYCWLMNLGTPGGFTGLSDSEAYNY